MWPPNEPRQSILLAEDDPNDVFFVNRALNKAGIAMPLYVVPDGHQAIDYLAGEGDYDDREQYPLPSLVFLDIKLPRVDGLEVLQWLKEQPILSELPVAILTASEQERDQEQAFALGALFYLVKPPQPRSLQKVIHSMQTTSC